MSKFKIEHSWLTALGTSELEASMCRLKIILGEKVLTKFRGDHISDSDYLEMPIYYIAEWIAENWWALLFEPRKTEENSVSEKDLDYVRRHSLLSAQNGFALPRLLLTPTSDYIELKAFKRVAPFADIKFVESAEALIERKYVKSELSSFVDSVVNRLNALNVRQTNLQAYWKSVKETKKDEELFCKLMGMMGLSPYDQNGDIELELINAVDQLGTDLAIDLCLSAKPDNFKSAILFADKAIQLTHCAQEISLEPLKFSGPPPVNHVIPAWRRGVQAATKVRNILGIKEDDPKGGDLFFTKLGIDANDKVADRANDIEENSISGAVVRNNYKARIGLLQHRPVQRRFAAARGAYTAWTSEHLQESRLLTQAVTRDQQENRAFAAEMMSPIYFLRKNAVRSVLTESKVNELAAELNIGADVIRNQAQNNGLQLI